MSKWKYRGEDDHDKLSKYQKIRKKHEKRRFRIKTKKLMILSFLRSIGKKP